ncbi:MAG: GWxTD domain-containing protein [Salinivirgaceae bacterium]|nr:GWxTD domain-containing protein [Salinivirgaceae bacterium]
MKRFFLLLTFTLLLFHTYGQAPTGHFHYAQFMDIEGSPYLETYLAVAGNSVTYKSIDEDKEQASVEVSMIFKNGDIVKAYRKFNLKSAEIEKYASGKPAFLNLERFSLENGTYNFELTLKDNYIDSAQFTYHDIITVNVDKNEVSFGGITLAESMRPSDKRNQFSKSGFDIIPYVSNFYPDGVNNIRFYAEIYNLDKQLGRDSAFIVKTYIEGASTRRLYKEFAALERKKAAPINVIMKSFDITKLNSGNYNLVIEVRNKQNQLVAEYKKFIQRSNDQYYQLEVDYTTIEIESTFTQGINNFNQLEDYIYALYPIANRMEQNFILQDFTESKMKLMQQFFYNFWKERNPSDPEEEWNIYKNQLKIVQKHFGYGQRRGYSTDLGRIYLKYGPPSSISEEHLGQQQIISTQGGSGTGTIDAVDYQIWHYYKVNEQTDRIFIFVKGLGTYNLGEEYVLLYTDVSGEVAYDDGLSFSSVGSLLQSVDSKLLRDIQNESARALSRFLRGKR